MTYTRGEIETAIADTLPWPRPKMFKVGRYTVSFDWQARKDDRWSVRGTYRPRAFSTVDAAVAYCCENDPGITLPDDIQV